MNGHNQTKVLTNKKEMFYLRLNKVRVKNNREFFGKAEIQIMSFVNAGESDFPMLQEFFTTNDEIQKKELVKQAITKVISSRITAPIQKIGDNQSMLFGDTGFIVHKDDNNIPTDLNWMIFAIEKDEKTRSNAQLASEILTENNVSNVVGSILTLTSLSNPVTGAITVISNFIAEALPKIFANDRDDLVGYYLASFIEKIHYPAGKRDKQDVPDLTDNMFIDYTIFAY